jgi:hypothetical protein
MSATVAVQRMPALHEIVGLPKIAFWLTVSLLAAMIIIGLVMSIFAWDSAQPSRPYLDLERDFIVARGNLTVNGESWLRSKTLVNNLYTDSINYSNIQVITVTGTIALSPNYSFYRIDTPGAHTITIELPSVADALGHMYHIFVSQDGANNTVNINVAAGDLACNGNGATGDLPSYVLPIVPGDADSIMIVNDHNNAWSFIAHTKQ